MKLSSEQKKAAAAIELGKFEPRLNRSALDQGQVVFEFSPPLDDVIQLLRIADIEDVTRVEDIARNGTAGNDWAERDNILAGSAPACWRTMRNDVASCSLNFSAAKTLVALGMKNPTIEYLIGQEKNKGPHSQRISGASSGYGGADTARGGPGDEFRV